MHRIAFPLLFAALVSCAKTSSGRQQRVPTHKFSFDSAKVYLGKIHRELAKTQVQRTVYCGCRFDPSSNAVDRKECGYVPAKETVRARRIEWEHVTPADAFGKQRPCWKKGGRAYCRQADPMFRRMEADLNNLLPAIGELNAIRSNHPYGTVSGEPRRFGKCDFEVVGGVAEYRPEVAGMIARIRLYMYMAYPKQFAEAPSKKLMAQLRADAARQKPSPFEVARNNLIKRYQPLGNPLIK